MPLLPFSTSILNEESRGSQPNQTAAFTRWCACERTDLLRCRHGPQGGLVVRQERRGQKRAKSRQKMTSMSVTKLNSGLVASCSRSVGQRMSTRRCPLRKLKKKSKRCVIGTAVNKTHKYCSNKHHTSLIAHVLHSPPPPTRGGGGGGGGFIRIQ
jgi:hypothetical protein